MNGFEAKLYYKAAPLSATPDRTGWTELSILKDVTLNDEFEEVDVSTRAGAGRKATDVGLRDNSVDLEIDWVTTDAGFAALFTAYKTRAAIALAVMGGVIATASGVAGNWKVTKFTRNEPLGGQVTANVTVKANAYMGDL